MFCSRVRFARPRRATLLAFAQRTEVEAINLNIRTWDFINYFSGIAVIYEEVES